jgi:ferredoxin--NADP+ reductase
VVGKTTMLLSEAEENGYIADVVGPLGNPSHLDGIQKAAVIGGGLGCAIAYPQAKALHSLGASVEMIAGFRTRDLVILEDEMKAVSDKLFIMTDDGSYGEHGLVTNKLKERIEAGADFDTVIAIGPLIMMKFVCKLTREYGIRTVVSMNPVMIDGTGMCGGCRLTVGGETKFACVDGPEFDGHLIDFDEVIRRASMYKEQEQASAERHKCRLEGMLNG